MTDRNAMWYEMFTYLEKRPDISEQFGLTVDVRNRVKHRVRNAVKYQSPIWTVGEEISVHLVEEFND
jgi:hypothetical protein